jgi:nicotinate-nucleotide pyrophosphorylase (carboxylating)
VAKVDQETKGQGIHPPAHAVADAVERALSEDVGPAGDVTTALVPADAVARFALRARQDGVLAGRECADATFRRLGPTLTLDWHADDGAVLTRGDTVMEVTGPLRPILTAERTALNFLGHLSGVATLTARFVAAAHQRNPSVQVLDTRKTTPGLRMLEKHAVVCGGGSSHRLGLDGGIVIKDNHIAISGSITAAVKRARSGSPLLTKIEVECDRLDQVREALAAKADVIMLDNMSLADMREAVKLVGGAVPLEASGGVRFDTIRGIAETGVDFISTSKITQAAPAVDIGLDDA